ncbi:hypothetical protein [Jatrophihabitans sp.]|uniref:hypothetical protein n=1 Tax=Jatrophihabitans sp. TaxID=1932789 RepID=UPI002C4E2EBE|nr:hypothetical protein [Jatrophihabitans sp.]
MTTTLSGPAGTTVRGAMTDPRRLKLKQGLCQLRDDELSKIIEHRNRGGDMVYDKYNYEESTGFY